MAKKQSAKQLKVTLVRSLIGTKGKHRVIAGHLGLKRMHQSVIIPDVPTMRGQIEKIAYLLKVEEYQDAA